MFEPRVQLLTRYYGVSEQTAYDLLTEMDTTSLSRLTEYRLTPPDPGVDVADVPDEFKCCPVKKGRVIA